MIVQVARELVSSLFTRSFVRRLDVAGENVRVVGRPHLDNQGRMEVGSDLVVLSDPIQSHFITAPTGVLRIGNAVWFDYGTAMSVHSRVTIGDRVHFGPQVIVMDSNFHEVRDRDSDGAARPIVIGNGVRIGASVTILQGVTIGEGSVILEGSVVSRSIPAFVRAAGVPARPVEPIVKHAA